MSNPLASFDGRRSNGLGREGLEQLCIGFNQERAARGMRERYFIDKSGPVWRLGTFHPDNEPKVMLIERK